MPGQGALLLLAFVGLVVIVLLVLLQLTRLGYVIQTTTPGPKSMPARRRWTCST